MADDSADPAAPLALATLVAVQQSPAMTYLKSLSSDASEATQRASLRLLADLMLPGTNEETFPWAQLTAAHIGVLTAQLNKRYAPASTQKHLSALRGTLKAAWRNGQIKEQDALARLLDQARGPKQQTDAPLAGRCLETPEIDLLFGSCAGYANAMQDATILALAYGGGLRRFEIAGLPRSAYAEKTGVLTFRGKGNKVRTLTLPPTAQAVLAQWCSTRGTSAEPSTDFTALLARVRDDGTTYDQLGASAIYERIQKIAARANVADFSPHDLRRSFITHLLERGVDPFIVAKLAGHENPKTTMRYDRRKEATKAAATAKLEMPVAEPIRKDQARRAAKSAAPVGGADET